MSLKKRYFKTKPVSRVTFRLSKKAAPNAEKVFLVGDFNGWNDGAPSMIQIEPCVWVDTLDIAAPGCYFMKFRTGSDWTSNDYYNCGPQDDNCQVPLTGAVCHNGTEGDPPALGKMEFEVGTYEFRLDEANLTYAITKLE